MTTLATFDPATGTLRRYEREGKQVKCTGMAKFDPWQELPVDQRLVAPEAVEAFRTQRRMATLTAPTAA